MIAEKEIAERAAPAKLYYSDEELCQMFGVSKRTTARWRELGLIEFWRVPGGNIIRYSAKHVAEFARRHEQNTKRGRRRS